jgi:UDP-glucuronate 4-epimerase
VLAMIERVTGRALRVRREAEQRGDMRDTFADTSRAKTDLGFAPSKPLETGLAAESEWLAALLATSPR